MIAAAELVEAYLVPSPGATLDVLAQKTSYLTQHSWVTTYETLLGFVIAGVVGVFAAVVMVSRDLRDGHAQPLPDYHRPAERRAEAVAVFARADLWALPVLVRRLRV